MRWSQLPALNAYIGYYLIYYLNNAAAKSCQSCPTLCDPIDSSPPGSRTWDSPGKHTGVGWHFLLQCVKVKSLSRVQLLATPWTATHQAPPSMGFSRQEYWSGVPLPSLVHITSHVQFFATSWTVCSPLGSSVHGISQARILEQVVISFSKVI